MEKQALVIGVAGGLGGTVASQLIDRGYRVVGTVLDTAQREEVQSKLAAIAGISIIDLSDGDSISTGLSSILSDERPLDAVVVCAAISPHGPLETTSLAALRKTLEINTIASVAVYQATMPHLRRTRGRMVLVSSIAGRMAFPMLGHYSASKFALEALADVMRRESAKWGVDMIVVEPGGIKTPMVTGLQQSLARERGTMTDGFKALYGDLYDSFERSARGGYDSATPPEEVAQVIVEILTDSAKPAARYPIGPDGIYICGISRTMSDLELDRVAKLDTANDQLNKSAG